ncbi:MAG: MBL fold metallo-hydrolase [Gemmatimonadaceae bacterium]|nr:MBL fold metallo-hydrolase [Gemmatimonadaceae bacterium]
MKLTFLGTGTSFGIPIIGCGCAVCHSTDPRDRRTRIGAVIETDGGTRLLIDTPPELRLQLVSAGIGSVDAVFFTHDHADHIHGIDDIRAITVRQHRALPMYAEPEVLLRLAARFPYVFDATMRPLPGTSKPEGEAHPIRDGDTIQVGDACVEAIALPHGRMRVLAFRVGALGFVTDAKTVPPEAVARLRGVKVLVLNALFRREHPTHLSIGEAVAVAAEIGAERTYLVHLTHETSHAELEAELPPTVRPAYDGLVVEV